MLNRMFIYLHQYLNYYTVFTTVYLLIGIYLAKRFYNYAQLYCYIRWKLPGPKLDHPILGMKGEKITGKVIRELETKHKLGLTKISRVIFGPMFSVWVTDPEAAQLVYGSAAPKNETFSYMLTSWLGKGILLSNGSLWKRNRRLLTPTFHYQSLRNFVKIMNKSSDRLVQIINRDTTAEEPINYTPLVNNLTLEVILNCICSKDSDLQINIDSDSKEFGYIKGIEQIRVGFAKRFEGLLQLFDTYYYRIKEGKQFLRGVKLTQTYIKSLIDERESTTKRDAQENSHDMLDLLLSSRDKNGNGLTAKEIVDELNTFVFAGHDTTASASSFVLYFLAKYPELQQKCREEVFQVIGGRNEIEWEDIPKLTYLTCFIKESLRHHGPAINISKTLSKPIKVDDYVIPAGVNIDILIALIHMNPKYWPDPHVFDPTRFSEERLSKQHPYAFIPFSAGHRNCIAQNFAMSELKILTAKIIRNFSVSLPKGFQLETAIAVVHGPSGGLPVIFKPL